ncbi:glycosyltransferase [Barnesiella viscericola]|uniref:glycosyltransferase n=1 Tax=Barnesiella viscericola TaxID=397865 RepID=UPI00255BAA3D|nr:glycosyltransferase [Barnesiella viscericola]
MSLCNKMGLSPVVIFAFNRPQALHRLIESLKLNALYQESEIFVYVDGPRSQEEQDHVNAVIDIAKEITSNVIASPVNKGLGTSIIQGVSTIIEKYGKIIVLEDDLVCTPNFLSYMNQALDFYEKDNRIISVCGYGLKIKRPRGYTGDVYLSGRSSSWGWATWKDRWEQVDWSIRDWAEFSVDRVRRKAFNRNGSDMYTMLKGYMEGRNHSWAIRFCYNQFKLEMYSVCPFLSKVNNEGFGENATNCKQRYSRFKTELDTTGCSVFSFDKDIKPNKDIEKACYHYHSIQLRIYSKIRKILHL